MAGTNPIRVRTDSWTKGFPPSTVTAPSEAGINPVRTRMRVDLPLPLGPTMPVMPGPISSVTWLRPTTSP